MVETHRARRSIASALLALALAVMLCFAGCAGGTATGEGSSSSGAPAVTESVAPSEQSALEQAEQTVEKSGTYTSKYEVAAYIHQFGKLPGNYVSKTKAKKAGWDADEGNLDEVLPGKSIGGSKFYNDDGALPDKSGRTWRECDIDYSGGYRGPERLVYSSDGLIYYTGDHYATFERLY